MSTSVAEHRSLELFAMSPRRIGRFLAAFSVALAVASFAMHLVQRSRGGDSVALLDVGDEVSLGTWFETIQFLFAAVALASLARSAACAPNLAIRVRVLAAVFLGLSIDESISLHERAGSILRDVFSTTGYLYYIWVVPAVAATLVLAVWQIPWLRSLPAKQRDGIVGSGALFLFCAGGLEMLAAPGDEESGTEELRSIVFTAFEELGEMLALSIFIAYVLSLLIGQRLTVRVTEWHTPLNGPTQLAHEVAVGGSARR